MCPYPYYTYGASLVVQIYDALAHGAGPLLQRVEKVIRGVLLRQRLQLEPHETEENGEPGLGVLRRVRHLWERELG